METPRSLQRLRDLITPFNSYLDLQEQIASANAGAGRDPARYRIDRRKLSKLMTSDGVSLSPFEMEALDAYLRTKGKSLADILDRPSPLRALADTGHVAVLFGARPASFYGEKRGERDVNNIARWDVHGLADLLRSIHRVRPGVRVDIHEALFDECGLIDSDPAWKREEWARSLDGSPSCVALASPLGSHGSEAMLARMFGVPAFRRGTAESEGLPFAFIWTKEVYDRLPSSFSASDERAEPLEGPAVGIVIDGERRYLEGAKSSWRSYAVIAAQRRNSGQVWLVIAGLSGPATCAAAGRVDSIIEPLPESEDKVLWSVVEVAIEVPAESGRSGDRRVVKEALRGATRVWEGTSL